MTATSNGVVTDRASASTGAADVYATWQQSNQELAAAATSLGDLPLVVLRHGKPLPTRAEEAAWRAAQAKQAALSRAGHLVVAERSGHAIPLDQPELVMAAAREVIQHTTGRSTSRRVAVPLE